MKSVFTLFLLAPFFAIGQSWEEVSKKTAQTYHAGQYEQAVPLARQALKLAAAEFGATHLNYFNSVNDLASALKKVGAFTEAQLLEQQNLQTIGNTLGTENLTFINTLKNLGNTCLALENYQLAELYYSQAIIHLGKIIAKRDAYYTENSFLVFNAHVSIMLQSGVLLQRTGRARSAEETYLNLIVFCKDFLGDDYVSYTPYATLINNLALNYMETNPQQAEIYLKEALDLHPSGHGENSAYYFQTLLNLASVYERTNRPEEANSILNDILEKIKQNQGTNSYDYITTLNNLGQLHFNLNQLEKSEQYTSEALRLQEETFGKNNLMYQTLVHNLAETYQWQNRFNEAEALFRIAVQKVLTDVEKNFSYLSESEKRSFYQHNALFINEYANFALFKSGAIPLPDLPKEQLSKNSLSDLYNLQLSTKALILNATAKTKQTILGSKDTLLINRFERWELLKEHIAQQYNLPGHDRLNLDSLIQQAESLESMLNKYSTLFKKGYVTPHITWQDVQKKLKPGEAAVELVRYYNGLIYVALIVTPQTRQHPEIALIKSSKTKNLEEGFLSYYKNSIRLKTTDTISYNQFWKPVYDTLKKYSRTLRKVYLSPDGIFNEVNFNTLQNPVSQKFVVDETEIHLVTNTRDIPDKATKLRKGKNKRTAVLLGRPDYGSINSSAEAKTRSGFADLEGTEKEVNDIAALLTKKDWQTKVLTAQQASEESIKELNNPQVLHLATHGYFVPLAGYQNNFYIEATLQSGIVLAHAGNPQPGQEDGILTAYEAMHLNLDSTELVVLSACETGLGGIEAGEGVYGLQRTLKVAGASTILMSLWKVDDTATQELMTLFYQKWLKGKPKREAFRLAQLELKKKYPQPYYWGSFVMTGD
ncbi:MAG: CHAT domain-containing protein [Cytophagales bacterium]|jgi:CHAT domain-containing protein|nr:CHAT domain-containing protein [Cytophagales bacterium]